MGEICGLRANCVSAYLGVFHASTIKNAKLTNFVMFSRHVELILKFRREVNDRLRNKFSTFPQKARGITFGSSGNKIV